MSKRRKDTRINIRLDDELKKRVQEYCDRNHVTVTHLVTALLVQAVLQSEEVEQI
jgi:antitoxin component of RelBE/YafQ-DinJ toxin-antitoxin module